jgi:arginine/ornithine transport system permease protein
MIDWQIVAESLPLYWEGLKVTLTLLAICVASGFVLSVPLAMARASANPWVSGPVWAFTYVIRGTPLLVQIFLIYYGLAQFDWVRESALWPAFRSAWFCAWLAFTINTTAYSTEIFAGAIRQTPWGEIEAARSLGLSGWQVFRRIFWPGAWRRALPQYGNEVVMLMHATALASTITLVELLRVARDVYYNHLLVVEAFGTVAVIYFGLTYAMTGAFKLLERHYLRHLDPRASARHEPAGGGVAAHA